MKSLSCSINVPRRGVLVPSKWLIERSFREENQSLERRRHGKMTRRNIFYLHRCSQMQHGNAFQASSPKYLAGISPAFFFTENAETRPDEGPPRPILIETVRRLAYETE